MRKVELLPTWDCEPGYATSVGAQVLESAVVMQTLKHGYEDYQWYSGRSVDPLEYSLMGKWEEVYRILFWGTIRIIRKYEKKK